MADDLTFDFERTFTDHGAPGGFQVRRRRSRAKAGLEGGVWDGRRGNTKPLKLWAPAAAAPPPPLPPAPPPCACGLPVLTQSALTNPSQLSLQAADGGMGGAGGMGDTGPKPRNYRQTVRLRLPRSI